MTRRRSSGLWGALFAAVTLSGCVVSVDPVLTESDAEFDPTLLGRWVEVGGTDRARISRGDGDRYVIAYRTGERRGRFEARLGRLGGHRVLDLWPAPDARDALQPYDGLLVGTHVLLVLDTVPEGVRVRLLDPDSVGRALRTGEAAVGHRSRGDRLVLSGQTASLRSVLTGYLSRPGFLSDLAVWRRAAEHEATERPPPAARSAPCFEGSSWPEADRLFRHDAHWIGADVASTVALGDDRILWLFGDTWIDPSGRGRRRGAAMVSNSIAVQAGSDPTTASMTFFWGSQPDGRPGAWAPDRDGESLWFGNGVRVRDRLVLFLSRVVRGAGTGLGFDQAGWTALMVENPDDEPTEWRVRELETPPNPLGVLVGFAGILQRGGYVYALGSQNPVKSHPVFAVRWPEEEVRDGELGAPEWWAGSRVGWVPDSSATPRWPLFENGQSELSIHYDAESSRFVVVQTRGFGPADLILRAAPGLEGPWSTGHLLYRPPEHDRPNVMIYAARAHPELTGADLALTYVTNSFDFGEHLTDRSIYYPRFVRLSRCR